MTRALTIGLAGGALVLAFAWAPSVAHAAGPSIRVDFGNGNGPAQIGATLKMLLILTGISLAPTIILTMTSFIRIAVVFSFLRSALGVQNMPPQQVLMGLSLFMTIAIMSPTATVVYDAGLGPYLDGKLDATTAFSAGIHPVRSFLAKQTREADLALFYDMTETARPTDVDDIKIRLLVPAFIISELRTSFEMGFLLFAPFLVLDLVIASILMSMGMVMLPPALISLPIKIMLFVLADGWNLLVGSLVRSFA